MHGSGDDDDANRKPVPASRRAERPQSGPLRDRALSLVPPHLRGGDHEDLAQQSADDALVALLAKLDDFRGESRFTTWAYKFALLEAGTKLRRRALAGPGDPARGGGLGGARGPSPSTGCRSTSSPSASKAIAAPCTSPAGSVTYPESA
jgi:hypothetical protein